MATTLTRRVARKFSGERQRTIAQETRRKLFLEALEDRRLMAGVEDWTPEMLLDRLDIKTPVYGPQPLPTPIDTLTIAGSWSSLREANVWPVRRELVVVDGGVQDYQQLLNDLGRGSLVQTREIEAILIDTSVDGIEALTKVLEQVRDLDAIHIVSHGGPGMLKLGNVTLTAENLDQYADQILSWKSALVDGADLMLYGCDLAGNEAGRLFIDSLQDLTGADVAASYDTTGDLARGNNWELEYQTGQIDTQTAFSQELLGDWDGTLSTRTYAAGSYVIDMGQTTQTIGNSLKPYGLLYDLLTNHRIPVSWAIAPNKDWAFVADAPTNPPGTDTIGSTTDFTARADHDWNPATAAISKSYRGGSFIIQASVMTPAILTTINTWRAQGVVVDPITESFTAEIYDDVTSFPKAVLDAQNGKLAVPYYANAGVPTSSYRVALPSQLNPCEDVFIIPHADPHAWPAAERLALNNFILNNRGGMWAGCHSPSSFESFGGLITDYNMNYLSSTGLIPWGSHADGTPPYQYNQPSTADDPIMQLLSRFDGAMQNGSEQIYIPQTTWRPTTTVAVYDAAGQANRPSPSGPQVAPAAVVYGKAFGDQPELYPNSGFVMYEAGHSLLNGTAAEQIAAQRAFFNFIVYNGILRAPKIDVTLPNIVAGELTTLSSTITGGSGSGTYQWISYNGSTFSQPTGTWTAGVPISTQFLLTVPNDTIKLLVTDSCGRRSVYAVGVSDTPPVLIPVNPGCFEGSGVAVPAINGSVDIQDNGTYITSAAVRLTARPDGAAETLTINQSLAASYGIAVSPDGSGGFNLTGSATHVQYEAVLNSLRYANSLANPTLVDRVITITVNDGASNSNTLTSTLRPPTTGNFTNSGGTPVASYYTDTTIYVRITDNAANTNPATQQSFSVTLTSSSGDSETVTMTETGMNTGIFAGSIASTSGANAANVIRALAGDTLTVSHISAAGCNTWIGTAAVLAPTFEWKDLYLTPTLGLDRIDPVATSDLTTSTQTMVPPDGGDDMTGAAVYSLNNNNPGTNPWNGESFGTQTTVTRNGVPRTMAGAAAPNRDERIVIMTDDASTVDAMIWNGTAWSVLNRSAFGLTANTNLGTGITLSNYWAADVVYEQQSGRAMLVWNDNGVLRYGLWNGTTGSNGTVTGSFVSTARQVRLAADPNSDRIALVVNYDNELDAAYIWNGSAWVHEQLLDANTAHDRTDINVAFESKSGQVMVVYASGTTGSVGYHTFDPSADSGAGAWTSSGTISPPSGTDGYARWTAIASDPNSDRIVLGVLTNGPAGAAATGDVWMRIWDGSAWGTATLGAANVPGTPNTQKVAVAFESISGQALVTYPSGTTAIAYRTWNGTSWSGAATIPGTAFVATTANSMTLDANRYSNQIMLAVQDGANDVNLALWDDTTWIDVNNTLAGTQTSFEVSTNTGSVLGQPFVYVWDVFKNTTPASPFYLSTIRSSEGTSADSYVRQRTTDEDKNFGTETTMIVVGSTTDERRSYLRFDLSSVSGATVESAQLSLFISTAGNNNPVSIYRVTSSWTESGITWTNKPGHDTLIGTIPAGTAGTFTLSGGNFQTLVQQWLDYNNTGGASGYNNFGLAFVGGGGNQVAIVTGEGTTYSQQPTLTVRTRDGNSVSATFTQTPAFAAPFEIYHGAPVQVTSYIQVTAGTFPASPTLPNIDAILKNGTGTLLSMTGFPVVTVVNAAQKIYKLEWSGNLAATTTVPTGDALSVTVTSFEPFSFNILHDSTFYPSRVSLPTDTVIALDSLGIYNAAYPGGTPITSIPTVGTPVYIRATVSDPFGKDDITSLDVAIKDAGGNTVLSTTLNNTQVVASTDATKTYQFAWTPTVAGAYTIRTTAHEGYEGTVSATDETPLDVALIPDLTLTKTDGGVTVAAGATVSYVLSYQNIGTGLAHDVTIVETLPAGTTFNGSASSDGWVEGPTGTFSYLVDHVPAGTGGTVTFAVNIASPLLAGVAAVTNSATIPPVQGEVVTNNQTATDSTPVNAAPDLRITKTDNDLSVAAGGTVTYTLTYQNVGTQDATGVVITETLPAGAAIHPDSLEPSGPWTLVSGQQYRTTIGSVPAHPTNSYQVTIKLVAPNPVAQGVELWTNTAAIADDGTNGPDLNPLDNTVIEFTPVDAAPDLHVEKTDNGASTVVGGTILYTISYRNEGTQGARAVSLIERLPAYTRFDPINSVGDWDYVGLDIDQTPLYTLVIGDLAVGASGLATFAVIVDGNPATPEIDPLPVGVAQVSNKVLIRDDGSNGEDPVPGNNEFTETTPVFNPAPTDADLRITKTNGVSQVYPGGTVIYTIVVRNDGPGAVTGATVYDRVHSQMVSRRDVCNGFRVHGLGQIECDVGGCVRRETRRLPMPRQAAVSRHRLLHGVEHRLPAVAEQVRPQRKHRLCVFG